MNEKFSSQEVACWGMSGTSGEFGGPDSCLLHPHLFLEPLQEDPGAEYGPRPTATTASLGEEAGTGGCGPGPSGPEGGEPLNAVPETFGDKKLKKDGKKKMGK